MPASNRTRRIVTAAFGAMVGASAALADGVSLLATQDPQRDSYFTLDFGPPIGATQAFISQTEYELAVDAASGTARFVDYYQTVGALELPGGFTTGAIQIEILPGTSAGTYDAATGQFSTSEIYAVHFEGDLSAFGLTSPVYLPSGANGGVEMLSDTSGRISMEWNGQGVLTDPLGNPLPFTYTCVVNTLFMVDDGCPQPDCEAGDVDRDCDVDLDDLVGVLDGFGTVGPAARRAIGDLDNDGAVGLTDLALLLSAFGGDCN